MFDLPFKGDMDRLTSVSSALLPSKFGDISFVFGKHRGMEFLEKARENGR